MSIGRPGDPLCSRCQDPEVLVERIITAGPFDSYAAASSEAKEEARAWGCDVFVDRPQDDQDRWVTSIYDRCAYRIVNEQAHGVDFDHLNNSAALYYGRPYNVHYRGTSLRDVLSQYTKLKSDIHTQVMIESYPTWRVTSALSEEQKETVMRLAHYFDNFEFIERKFNEIEDYDDYVHILTYAL